MNSSTNYRPLQILIGFAVLVNFSGLFVPLMDPDAGVYASISKTMVLQNDFINLFYQGADWLDKPHFPFWVTALFLKVFGFNTWAYKLPGILFLLMGALYTYLFAKKYYNKPIALLSVFILLTSIHIIISNNDVRAEPFLTGLIIASIYHFSQSLSKKISLHLVMACLFAAFAIMTKGIFTLIPIGAAVAGELFIKKNWKEIFHWRWIVAMVLVTIFILPELYCLWFQFDNQPNKIVFGNNNVSGIKFFLWDSQFGRFFNTGPIKGKGDYSFFLHTLLWAILPWSLIMYAAIFSKIRNGIKKVKSVFNEWFTLSGSLLTLLVFSFSAFQLPHYSNIIFPLLAILCAHFIWQLPVSGQKILHIIQDTLGLLLIVLTIALAIFYNSTISLILLFILVILIVVSILLKIYKKEPLYNTYLRSGFIILLIAVYLNLSFYNDVLKYQSGNQVAFYLNKNHPNEAIARISASIPSGEFYLNQPMQKIALDSVSNGSLTNAKLFYITQDDLQNLDKKNCKYEILKSFDDFHVTMLNVKFLNPKTRSEELQKRYLIRLN